MQKTGGINLTPELSQFTEIEKKLKVALLAEELAQAKAAIEAGADLNQPYFMMQLTPLQYAAHYNYVEQMKLLLQYSDTIQINAINPISDNTALHEACWNGCTATILLLLEHGANANISAEETGFLPLHLYLNQTSVAIDTETLQKLVAVTEDLNLPMLQNTGEELAGASMLHLACLKKNAVEILEELKASGKSLDINALDDSGLSPLHYAVQQENEGAVACLLAYGAQVNIASDPHIAIIRHDAGWTPLHYAAHQKNLNLCRLLLRAGADPDFRTAEGLIARELYVLTISSEIKILEKYSDTLQKNLSTLQQQRAAELKAFDDLVATSHYHSDTLQLLIEKGANVNAVDEGDIRCKS